MWIEPNGVVKILNGVPLDEDYNNTLHFAGRIAQYNYFNSKVKYTYDKITYQRIRRNYIRVEINGENLYDCNYLMFQNSSFGNRWFYAFITNVEYLSNMVSEIEYQLDEVQTWLLDCTIKDSFVEREHSRYDNVGENRVDEKIEYGDFIIAGLKASHDENNQYYFDDNVYVIAVTEYPFSGQYAKVPFHVHDGIGTGLKYIVYSDVTDVRNLVAGYNGDGKEDAIISIFQCPSRFFQNVDSDTTSPDSFAYTLEKPTDLNGYTPRNNKLLQYPYNCLYVTDGKQNSATYNYEDFNYEKAIFSYQIAGSCDPSMMIVPLLYKGVAGYNYNEKMVYKGYPQCSWNTDMWKSYVAQNGGVIPTVMKDIAMPIVGGIAGSTMLDTQLTKTVASTVANKKISPEDKASLMRNAEIGQGLGKATVVAQVISSLGKASYKTRQPQATTGNYNGDIMYANNMRDFYYGQMCIREEFARRLDSYFDMFGYATNEVKQPNLSSRPHWNYVKVIDLNIFGNIPADSIKVLKSIFNNGITFWKNGDEVGDYSLNNKPV